MIGPGLHHPLSLWQVLGVGVGGAHRGALGTRELAFDYFAMPALLVQCRLRHAAEAERVICITGRLPAHGNSSLSKRQMILSLCDVAQFGRCLPNHLRAITSKLFSTSAVRAILTAL